jgi:hypothetical protein
MKNVVRTLILGAAACLVFAASSGTAWAKTYDQVQATVQNLSDQVLPLKVNGTTPGTIQLWYTVNAFAFTSGVVAEFGLDLAVVAGDRDATSYSDTLTLYQTGSQNLVLEPATPYFTVTGSSWTGSTRVTISIPPDVPGDPKLNVDGTDLVGNLQMKAEPSNYHLSTPTTVQVHIKLIHPTACLKVYDFLTREDDSTIVTAASVTVKKSMVRTTQPGQFSDDILVANLCPVPQSFDLQVSLDPTFQTNPHDNPGNAVFTYFTSGEVDPTTFALSSFGTGTPQGQQLCLGNVTVPANETFLATIHSDMRKGIAPPPSSATFSASLYMAGSGCPGTLDSLATPNPASTALTLTAN